MARALLLKINGVEIETICADLDQAAEVLTDALRSSRVEVLQHRGVTVLPMRMAYDEPPPMNLSRALWYFSNCSQAVFERHQQGRVVLN